MTTPTAQSRFGFLNLNKPLGWTSHDCVGKIRRLLHLKKVGHGGTLDPSATGVLPIAVGKVTRLLQFLPTEKAYRALIRFGVQTTTDDLEGEILETHCAEHLTLSEIEPYLEQLTGEIEQIPPAFSAIQKDGKRLYELARQGIAVEVPKRVVKIDSIKILAWKPGKTPELEVEIYCGGGTYIRAIARDLGALLGVGGTLAGLERTLSCGLTLSNSLTLPEIEAQLDNHCFALIPPEQLLHHLPLQILSSDLAKRWCQGQKIPLQEQDGQTLSSPFVRIYDQDQSLLGISELRWGEDAQLLLPKVVLQPYG